MWRFNANKLHEKLQLWAACRWCIARTCRFYLGWLGILILCRRKRNNQPMINNNALVFTIATTWESLSYAARMSGKYNGDGIIILLITWCIDKSLLGKCIETISITFQFIVSPKLVIASKNNTLINHRCLSDKMIAISFNTDDISRNISL